MNERSPRSHWPLELQRDFDEGYRNGCAGSLLVSETDKVRVWHLHIPAGKRCGSHRHVLTYFWTGHNDGLARGYFEKARFSKQRDKTPQLRIGRIHGAFGRKHRTTDLLFTTLEFLDSPNKASPVPDEVWLKVPADAQMKMAS